MDIIFYIYKLLDINKNLLYIGKTTNLNDRIMSHIDNGHLPKQCYLSVHCIEYTKLKTKVDMDIMELYLINKLKPIYNRLDLEKDEIETIITNQLIWEEFMEIDFKTIYKYKYKLEITEAKVSDMKQRYNNLLKEKYNNNIERIEHQESKCNAQYDKPYHMRHIDLKLEYISAIINSSISPTAQDNTLYFFEVVERLRENPREVFMSVNSKCAVMVCRRNELIITTDITYKICEDLNNKYIISLTEQVPDIGSYNLAGVVQLLSFKAIEINERIYPVYDVL